MAETSETSTRTLEHMRRPGPRDYYTYLRVGLCGCYRAYHDKLAGRRMRLDGRTYELMEYHLPDEPSHTKDLKGRRCHFFIDVTPQDDGEQTVFVARMSIIPSPKRTSDRLHYDMSYSTGMKGDRPFTPDEMHQQIRRSLTSMSLEARCGWLALMAP